MSREEFDNLVFEQACVWIAHDGYATADHIAGSVAREMGELGTYTRPTMKVARAMGRLAKAGRLDRYTPGGSWHYTLPD
jgi:hypothetical protein